MFQADALLPWPGRDNVALGLELRGLSKMDAAEQAESLAPPRRPHRSWHHIDTSSRAACANGWRWRRFEVLEPRILLMDEPFSALDVQTRQLMENELLEIWSSYRKSVLFVTHDLEEAISLSDRVVVLSSGPRSNAGDVKVRRCLRYWRRRHC